MLGRLLVIFFTNLNQELKLLLSILELILLNFAVDHTIKRGLVGLIKGRSLLVHAISSVVVAKHAVLVGQF